MEALAPTPAHVPPDRVVDFDFYHVPGGDEDVHLALKQLHDGPDIFWTPRNGGHWIATRAKDIEAIQRNWEMFSHKSLAIPPNATPSLPLETDPPEHTPLRALLSPLFAPNTLADVEKRARLTSKALIDGFIDRGHCEFSSDFARQLPIRMFLYLVDLPLSDAPMLLDLAEIRVRSSDPEARNLAKRDLVTYLGAVIAERRAKPGTDFISRVLDGDVGGRKINDFEAQNMLATLMFGGLDTVASMLGFVIRFLALSPDHRQKLVADKALVPKAVNELIRRHGLASTARIITRDAEFNGVALREGDRMLVITALFGLDERSFPDPLLVDFDRPNAASHAAFGNGPHRCPGANLARMELKIVLEEWLARIPDYRIDPTRKTVIGTGLVNGVTSLPLVWDVTGPA